MNNKEPLHHLEMVRMGDSLVPFRIDGFDLKGIGHYELVPLRPGLAELALTLIVYVPTGEDEPNGNDNRNRPRQSSAQAQDS